MPARPQRGMGGAASCAGRAPSIVPKPPPNDTANSKHGATANGRTSAKPSLAQLPPEHESCETLDPGSSSAVLPFSDNTPLLSAPVLGSSAAQDAHHRPWHTHRLSPTQQRSREGSAGGAAAGGIPTHAITLHPSSAWGPGPRDSSSSPGFRAAASVASVAVQVDLPAPPQLHAPHPPAGGSGVRLASQPGPHSPHQAVQGAGTQALQWWNSGPSMPSSWRRGESLGSGAYGTVFLGLNNDTGELMAVKEVSIIEGSKGQEALQQLEQEVALLSKLRHPSIVHYVGTRREGSSLLIFLEYVPGGSVSSLLSRFGPLSEPIIRRYTQQLLSGLAYLHAQRTMHRDVKGANLLVEKTGHVKLADFGMAKTIAEAVSFTKSFKGSAFWMAPEVIRQQGHGVAADIWSLGCTVLEMATGKPPWAQCATQVQAIFKIASSSELPAIPATLSPLASEFILLCLQRDPAARPPADALLKHPFVAPRPDEAAQFAFPPALPSREGSGTPGLPAHQLPFGSLAAFPPGNPHTSQAQPHAPGQHGSAQAAAPGAQAVQPPPAVLLPTSSVTSLPQGGAGTPARTEEELHDALTALVLGPAVPPSPPQAASQALGPGSSPQTASRTDARLQLGGGSAGSGTGAAGGSFAPGQAAVDDAQEDGDLLDDRELDEGLDVTMLPSHFRVRGLLTLPPLQLLQGGMLPALAFNAMYSQGRPGTTSSTMSKQSRLL